MLHVSLNKHIYHTNGSLMASFKEPLLACISCSHTPLRKSRWGFYCYLMRCLRHRQNLQSLSKSAYPQQANTAVVRSIRKLLMDHNHPCSLAAGCPNTQSIVNQLGKRLFAQKATPQQRPQQQQPNLPNAVGAQQSPQQM